MVTICKFCKRALRNPVSVERQAGLACAKKHGLIKIKKKKKFNYKGLFKYE